MECPDGTRFDDAVNSVPFQGRFTFRDGMRLHVFQGMLKQLAYKDLAKMTDNFSKENYIGIFQFGELYRGFFDKEHFTIKIWTISNLTNNVMGFRERNLMDELIMLCHERLAHPCIVNLYGYCRDKENLAVVYNFKSMYSLENIYLQEDFTWLQRMKVAFGLACLLAFLHSKRGDLDSFVIRNLCAGHIMLDENYNPKLVDFSMITGGFLPNKQVYSIQPAYGCVDYWDTDLFRNHSTHLATWTSKSDVFAFGVMLVSMLSKRVITDEFEEEFKNNAGPYPGEWASRKYEIDKSIVHMSLERDSGFSYADGQVLSLLAVNYYFSCAYLKDMERIGSNALKRYTNNFSEENYIGRFQFGKIFRGLFECYLKGPMFVTVKIWDEDQNPQHNLLRLGDEILLLHHEKYTCHPGMVRMYGYCTEDKHVAIVIFLKPMNSIRNLLSRGDFLWLYRIKAAYGVASLLKFLHDVSHHMDPFIIRNLDAAHILLDEEYNSKLIDFGLITGGIFPNRPTYAVKSSFECNDRVFPAYDRSGTWTTKSDVYSFGVLLLCLISKRNVMEPLFSYDGWSLTSNDIKKILVHKSLQNDSTFNHVDGQIVKRLIVQCVHTNPACRPNMSQVIEVLDKLNVVERYKYFISPDEISRVNYVNHSNMPKSHLLQHV
ncbi:G-type lectin S-receptor-like serine/threonine-protein kinase B120 [Impatiens glandulifera]|uniref:G-type lectin S-receptor-like serine/threonine-protein kinase B120 n=1 Tax=Impatiens glandulifera TaxID=253017 RepID=UPI001FB142AA|nr:G-type lectin S-receptor-like serine/threonine-protein kinase B120 [Impatiens glandulifera]